MQKNLEKSNQDLVKLLGAKTGQCDVLVEANSELKRQVSQLQANAMTTLTPPNTTLVLGSSIVRDFDTENHAETTVKCIFGGKIAHLQKMLLDSKDVYERVVLVVGGNNCDSSEDINHMLIQYSDLIDAAHKATGSNGTVKVSSVCPRADEQTQMRIDTFNIGLSVLCSDGNAEFVDNDDNF